MHDNLSAGFWRTYDYAPLPFFDDPHIELPPDDPVVPVAIGEVIHGKYRIGEIIGFGGMATVAAGHHLELDQPIAIKFLHPEQIARPDSVRRFLSEARAAARLSSPHVARVLDVGSAPTARGGIVPFMVMERLEGIDLDALLSQRGRLPVAEVVEYVLQACEGVAEAHALGIIHRDLKPGNLFLTRRRDGTPLLKLLDFGISKNVRRATSKNEGALTADREMMGSPRYVSPEQARSAKDVDPRTDIWSLGVILHELLCGTPPFEAESIADTIVAILHAPPRTIAVPDVPQALGEVITRCLQKNPEQRFASVEALAAALAPFRSSSPILLPELSARLAPSPNPDPGISVRTVRGAFPGGRKFLTGVVGFGAVGLVLLAIASFGGRRATHDAEASAVSALAATPPPGTNAVSPSVEPAAAAPLSTLSAADADAGPVDELTDDLTDEVTTEVTPPAPRPPQHGARKKAPRPSTRSAPHRRTVW